VYQAVPRLTLQHCAEVLIFAKNKWEALLDDFKKSLLELVS
jgi:hypothetical protein